MVDFLPSVRFEADDSRPVGFVNEVGDSHLGAVANALEAVASAVSQVTGNAEPALRVCFSSVRYMPTLPFVLYGFHIVHVDENGDLGDEVAGGQEVRYALVANHAVEVQREAALLFLYELVFRQAVITRLRDAGSTEEIDVEVAAADRQARREFRDRIYAGWNEAARSIAQRALASGLPIVVRYEVDVLPSRTDVVRRVPHLRAAYNDIDLAREAVDKQVSMIGGSDPRVHAPDLTQHEEDKIQRHLASLGMRHWISQTTRDALVCGNGYLVTTTDIEPGLYSLRPEAVEILGPEQFARLPGSS
jgi:hypothetical protein